MSKPTESQFFSKAKQRTGTGVLLANASEITRLERMLLNISVDDLTATIDGDNIRLYSDSQATTFKHPFRGGIKSGTTGTVQIGLDRTSVNKDYIRFSQESIKEDFPVTSELIVTGTSDQCIVYEVKWTNAGTISATLKQVSTFPDYRFSDSAFGFDLQKDITPHFNIVIGIIEEPNTPDVKWHQKQFSDINIDFNPPALYNESGNTINFRTKSGISTSTSVSSHNLSTFGSNRAIWLTGVSGAGGPFNSSIDTSGGAPPGLESCLIYQIETEVTGELKSLRYFDYAGFKDT